jgi:hypothetical protein
MERAIRGMAPLWEIEPSPQPLLSEAPLRLVCELRRLGQPDWAPLREANPHAEPDPLGAILEAVQPLDESEYLWLGLVVQCASRQRVAAARKQLTQAAPITTASELLSQLVGTGQMVPRFEPRLQKLLEERLERQCLELSGAMAIGGTDRPRLASRARSLTAVFSTALDGGFGGITVNNWRWQAGSQPLSPHWSNHAPSLLLTSSEIASFWHPLSAQVRVPGTVLQKRPVVTLPPQVARATGLLLGVHRERGRELPVHLPQTDLAAGHLICIGRTGVGKSTAIHRLVRQLIAASDRPGVGLLDPHGDLATDIVLRSVRPEREGDVIFLELGDSSYPIGLPLFWAPPQVEKDAQVQATFSILRLIFREHWSPTRMEDAVFAVTATLCQLSSATVMDVPRLFSDPVFRRRALAQLSDPVALTFWSDYEALSEASQREMIRPVLYRLRSFYRSQAIRNIVCQPKGINFVELLDRGAVLLVSLAGSAIQGEADLLGELLIAQLHLAALSRLNRPPQHRKSFFLAVDESQRFRGASLPILLSEGRKLGLPLLLSTQYLAAWGEILGESVLGNIGTLIAFRCGASDSQRLNHSIRPFTPDQLEDLDRFEAIAKLQIGGHTIPAFDFRTLPVSTSADPERLDRIRAKTRSDFARPRQVVESEINATYSEQNHAWGRGDIDEE